MKPISIQLYTVRDLAKNDFIGVLKQIAAIGYKGVEPAGLHNHKPADIRKVLDDLGMVCSSMHGKLAAPETLNETVDTAKALGCPYIITGWKREDWTTLDGVKRAADAFQAASTLLKPHGLKMGYHNHWWEMPKLGDKYALEHFYAMSPDTVAEIDIYWATNFGAVDTPALVKRLAKRTPLLHVKDGPLVEKQPHTAVGAGKMNIPACIAAADEKTLQWLIVELDACATDMMQAVKDSYKYLTANKLAEGKKGGGCCCCG